MIERAILNVCWDFSIGKRHLDSLFGTVILLKADKITCVI